MTIKGTKGDDDLNGTTGRDVFNMVQGGSDSVDGGDGADVFKFGAKFDATDRIDGGKDTDKLVLSGDYEAGLTIDSTMLRNVEQVVLTGGHNYNFTILDGVVASGSSLTFNTLGLHAADNAVIDGSSMTSASADTTLIVNADAGVTYFHAGTGTNILHAGSGETFAYFGGDFDAADHIEGGALGNNFLFLEGDYSAGLTITGAMLHNIQDIHLTGNFDFKLTTGDAVIAAGQSMHIDASALGAGHSLIFNGAHETDGSVSVTGSFGNDTITGGAQGDSLNGFHGGNDIIHGGGGNDGIQMYDALTSADRIDGGDGEDEMDLVGDYSAGVVFKATTMTNVEAVFLNAGFDYKLVMNDGNVAAGEHLNINGDLLHDTDTLYLDASHETDGSYYIGGGNGDDVLIGGQAGNTISGGYGQDHMTAGGGADVFRYFDSAGESTGVRRDTVTGFDAAHDSFSLNFYTGFAVQAVDTAVTSGALSGGHFDGNLSAALDSAHLGALDAVLFTPDSGTLAGHTFLVVDINGEAGYQAGDLVIQLESASHLGGFDIDNFI